ncbi:MAG: hypothetical protein ACTH2W_10925 [Vagococcus sp.]
MTNLTKETEKYQAIFKPLDPYGFDIDMMEVGQEVPNGWVPTTPPSPNWKPKWDGSKWVETATEEEKHPVIEETLTDIEKSQKENDELKNRLDMSESSQLETLDMLFAIQNQLKGGDE